MLYTVEELFLSFPFLFYLFYCAFYAPHAWDTQGSTTIIRFSDQFADVLHLKARYQSSNSRRSYGSKNYRIIYIGIETTATPSLLGGKVFGRFETLNRGEYFNEECCVLQLHGTKLLLVRNYIPYASITRNTQMLESRYDHFPHYILTPRWTGLRYRRG